MMGDPHRPLQWVHLRKGLRGRVDVRITPVVRPAAPAQPVAPIHRFDPGSRVPQLPVATREICENTGKTAAGSTRPVNLAGLTRPGCRL
ncbi:hypothetical protein Acel_0196 [Acidothermus cellulolyticus 11B]|uniref:Uncharacterized protein n=1 Tax=Acidothermus cellulolyticus (strain ATCC 43068 / DSM 8971 / 11B) TaxID=351607 RepID=A0LRB0_ACIC1|nr:hypothetical protein Acel_0196 [Acidothermus cellulolyticus 11B]